MPLAEANLINTLDFIYIEHNIYCNCIHQKNFKMYKCKKGGKITHLLRLSRDFP